MLPTTYRSRLLAYCVLLVAFVTGTLLYSYDSARTVLLRQAQQNAEHLAQLQDEHQRYEHEELGQYAKLLVNDQRLQRFVMLARLNGDDGPLQRLLQQEFGWLRDVRHMILLRDGRLLSGQADRDLLAQVGSHHPWGEQGIKFFYQNAQGLERVVVEPLRLGGEVVAAVVLSQRVEVGLAGGDSGLFLSRDGIIRFSSLPQYEGLPFQPEQGHLTLSGQTFRVFPLNIEEDTLDPPQLWFGVSETGLIGTLIGHGQRTLTLLALGMAAIIVIGLMVIRSFNKPLNALMAMTREVAQGRLPLRQKTRVRTEIDVLTNHFVDMIAALRDKETQINAARHELEHSAITDALTNLYNRRHLQDLFPKLFAQARRDGRGIAAILCDLDYFKQLNDTFSHLAGDQALRDFAHILRTQSRNNDFLYRMGGEEFLVLCMVEENQPLGVVTLAEKIRAATREHTVIYRDAAIPLTVSCGVAFILPGESADTALSQLLSRADKALYQAKQRGRNQVRVYCENEPSATVTPLRKDTEPRPAASV